MMHPTERPNVVQLLAAQPHVGNMMKLDLFATTYGAALRPARGAVTCPEALPVGRFQIGLVGAKAQRRQTVLGPLGLRSIFHATPPSPLAASTSLVPPSYGIVP